MTPTEQRVARGTRPTNTCAHCGQLRHPSFRRHCPSRTCTWWVCFRCSWVNGNAAAIRGATP